MFDFLKAIAVIAVVYLGLVALLLTLHEMKEAFTWAFIVSIPLLMVVYFFILKKD